MTGRVARWALRSYPPSFRERYGDELTAVVEDTGSTARTVVDVFAGSARAWLRPAVTGAGAERRRRRMQASVSTTWVAICAGFLVAPAVNRELFDQPVPLATASIQMLVNAAEIVIDIGALLALAAAIILGYHIIIAAIRSRSRDILRPLWLPASLAVFELGMTGVVAWIRSGYPAYWPQPSGIFVSATLIWMFGGAALIISGGFGPVIALVRAELNLKWLRTPAALCLPIAAALAVGTILCLIAVILTQTIGPVTVIALIVAAGASAIGMTSASRGFLAAFRSASAVD
jgi:hypothetical protein